MNREQVQNYLRMNSILPDSKFGQNFLCDDNICHQIVDICEVSSNDEVLEIGPGIGALTRILVEVAKSTTAIEIDLRLAEVLQNDSELSSLNLITSDYLKLSSNEYNASSYTKVLSNIPYYVMTPIMLKLLTECKNCDSMVFMVEDAAIARIIAQPGSKQYGPLSVLCNLYGEVTREFTVTSNCFIPAPHTTSAVISLKKNNNRLIDKGLIEFIEACFSMRRKKLTNSLNSYCNNHNIKNLNQTMEQMNIKSDIRAENLSPEQLYDLYNNLI